MNEANSPEIFFRVLLVIVALILALIFSGLHTFACLGLGFLWPYYLFYGNGEQKTYLLWGRWRIGHGRYSFLNLVKNLDHKLNSRFNSRRSPHIASLLRIFPPVLFFAILKTIFTLGGLEWYFILLGALSFEWAYAHGKRKILWAFLRKIF